MTVHAAFGGSTNLLLHIPAIAFAAGLPRPTVDDWHEVNRPGPPAGRASCPTARAITRPSAPSSPGGVPEVMLHLRALGLLDESRPDRHRRAARPRPRLVGRLASAADRLRDRLCAAGRRRPRRRDHEPRRGPRARGLTSTVTFPRGNLAPGGLGHQEHGDRPDASSTPTASTARPARPASSPARRDAIAAIKGQGDRPAQAGRRPRPDRPGADGGGDGGDLPDHRRR